MHLKLFVKMRILFVFILFFISLQSCSNPSGESGKETETVIDSSFVPHSGTAYMDCGMSPYLLLGDQMFTDADTYYECSVRFIKIANEKEPEVVNASLINKAIENANIHFESSRIRFKVEEIVVVEDPNAFREGISMYQKHGRTYSERGYLNVFIYPSTIGTYSAAAGGIPSRFFAIKEYYLATSTFAHEAAHCFGLYHIFTKDDSGSKSTFATGDLICDTPYADFYSQGNSLGYTGRVTDNCEYVGPLGGLTQEEHNINIRNITGYSLLECRKEFTKDQIDRVHWIINNSQDLKEMLKMVDI